MITPAFSLTATERVLPRLALDFTTASLDPRITFTRVGATATRVNASGFVESVAADTPRFDFNSITLVCRGLLIEEARTNLLLQSQNFGTSWSNTNTSEDVDVAISPDGTQNADKLIVNNGSAVGGSQITQIVSKAATATTYTYSVFGQAAGLNRMWLIVSDGASFSNRANFAISLVDGAVTISAGTAGTFTAASGAVTAFKDGWYRASLTFTSSTETSVVARIYPLDSSITTGDGVKGINIWGAQLEAGAFATSYIPTTTTALTRNADVATMTGTNFSDWYNASEGGVVARVLPSTVSGTRPALQFDDATVNDAITLRGVTTNPELVIIDGGSPQAQIDAGTIAANTAYNLGAAWNINNCAASVNGGAAVTDNSATIPTATQARLGSDGSNYLNGHLQTLRYWPQRIINAEMQAFSK